MLAKPRKRRSRLEALENRLALSGLSPMMVYNPPPPGTPPVYVAPATLSLPAIELPPGVAPPPGTVQVPAPVGPLGMAQSAEEVAVDGATAFAFAHPNVQLQFVTSTRPDGRFLLVMTEIASPSYAIYIVNEYSNGSVTVSFNANDLVTGISETIYANQSNVNNGGMLAMHSQNGVLQDLTSMYEIGGNTTTWSYTPPHEI